MEVSPPNVSKYGDEEKALKGLLDIFGSSFSLEAIASAYCKAGRNTGDAAQILCNMQESTSSLLSYSSNGESKGVGPEASSRSDSSEKSFNENEKFKALRQKPCPVSAGTVSSFLGKKYLKSAPAATGSVMATKPPKLDSNEWPISELWGEEAKVTEPKNDQPHKDMEDFLFKMLGDGFQLERDVIQQCLDKCGYDMQKSMHKLLDLSAVALDEKSKCLGTSSDTFSDSCPYSDGYQKGSQPMNNSRCETSGSGINGRGSLGQETDRNDIQKEVLAALFQPAERPKENLPRRITRTQMRSLAFGQVVTEPPREDFTPQAKLVSINVQLDKDNDEEDGYQLLRKAVTEYRATMKEYYKAAVDAYAMGDYDRANKLMDKGHFFHQKAQKADEESTQKIFEINNVQTQDELSLDVHEFDAKPAIRLLKYHISQLSGISSFRNLKVIIETNEKDTTKGARKRLIMKLLEKESIAWTEAGDAGTILIPLDTINPKSLSFSK
uniref:DUF1771 domain-containing protein n=2 Tax=Rhizophora mucronata TaxID=61149 RepID=A0A2P2KUR0_RHIMU